MKQILFLLVFLIIFQSLLISYLIYRTNDKKALMVLGEEFADVKNGYNKLERKLENILPLITKESKEEKNDKMEMKMMAKGGDDWNLMEKMMAVQISFYKRKTIYNKGFELFYIDENEYRFRNQTWKRNCVGKACVAIDHMKIIRTMKNYKYDVYFLIEDDIFFCSDFLTIYNLITKNKIYLLNVGLGSYVFTPKTIEETSNLDEGWGALRENGHGLDVMLDEHLIDYYFRTKVDLTVHLYQGSTVDKDHGTFDKIYPTCFEYASALTPHKSWGHYNPWCLPNDIHFSHSTKCNDPDKSTNMLNGYYGKTWINYFTKYPELRDFFDNNLDSDTFYKFRTKKNDLNGF